LERFNAYVCFEVEHILDKHKWRCVVVRGKFLELASDSERQFAWEELQKDTDWREPGGYKVESQSTALAMRPDYFKILPDMMTGREAWYEYRG
jgi:nitroimidazol reductase NimA-like FMN-containing flavoprotein (pyridoxamine 5'-phosphate oxidase superfamily)